MNDTRRGTNAAAMKAHNIRLILGMIHKTRASRAVIAELTGLTKATVTILTEELIREGLVTESRDEEYSGIGRCPLKLSICPSAAYLIGLSLDRRGYHMGLYDLSGKVICHEDRQYAEGNCMTSISEMAALAKSFTALCKGKDLLGIGVAAPGPIDYRNGRILNPPNFNAWHGCELQKELEQLTGLPVTVENIANSLSLSQKYFGKCLLEENYAYILVDDGIGSGIITEGEIYRGKDGYGNELGHTSIAYDGIKCSCGNIGCLECYASVPAILQNSPYHTWQEVIDGGDSALVAMEAGYLSCALTNLINLFDLERIVLGGTLAYGGEAIAKQIEETLSERVIMQKKLPVTVDKQENAGTLAGAAVALHRFLF